MAFYDARQLGFLRSFGRINGRKLRPQLQRFWDQESLNLLLPVPTDKLHPSDLFSAKVGRIVLEIGIGEGGDFFERASSEASDGYIGCDPYIPGIAKTLQRLTLAQLNDRVRLFADDARLLLAKLPDRSIDQVTVLFPDPWPKKRHRKRRLIDCAFLLSVRRVLKDDGVFVTASDHSALLAHIFAKLAKVEVFDWVNASREQWHNTPITRYHRKALAQGTKPVTIIAKPSLNH